MMFTSRLWMRMLVIMRRACKRFSYQHIDDCEMERHLRKPDKGKWQSGEEQFPAVTLVLHISRRDVRLSWSRLFSGVPFVDHLRFYIIPTAFFS